MKKNRKKLVLITSVLIATGGIFYFSKSILSYIQTVRDLGVPASILRPTEPTKAPIFRSKEERKNYFKNQPARVFLKEFTSLDTAKGLIHQLESLPEVKSVKFTSSEEAAQNSRETNQNNPTLLELMPLVFPASIEVYIDANLDDSNYKQLSEKVAAATKSYPFVILVLTQVDNLP